MENVAEEVQRMTLAGELVVSECVKAVGNVLEDACFLHWCVSGEQPLYPVFTGKELRVSPEFTVTIGPMKSVGSASPEAITQWEYIPFPALPKSSQPEQCSICLSEFSLADSGEIIRLGKCQSHFFHKSCIIPAFSQSQSLKCPVCGAIYGVQIGPMPRGTLQVSLNPDVICDGYRCGSWVLIYKFPSGKLPDGTRYTGTKRTAVVPDTPEGQEVVRLLVCAFYRRQTFAVGTSVTTGTQNTVVWNGIHHKTSTSGGPTSFGYPDPTYFARVKGELAARGVAYGQ